MYIGNAKWGIWRMFSNLYSVNIFGKIVNITIVHYLNPHCRFFLADKIKCLPDYSRL